MAKMVDVVKATAAAMMRMGAGALVQNQSSPVRAEKRVRKSLTDTLRYTLVVIWP